MTSEASIAANRFGLGAKPEELKRAKSDPRSWLKAQLTYRAGGNFGTAGNLTSSQDTLIAQVEDQRRQREQRQAAKPSKQEPDRQFVKQARRGLESEITARLLHASETQASFHERLVRFWSNHFTVSATKRQVSFIAGAYEREAIRPAFLGRFEDLALNAIRHPAMLIYLDNTRSVGPNSPIGQRRSKLGLNENLAREVLELHTVTPASGYTQKDVTEFSKALTGWTVGGTNISRENPGLVYFSDRLHEPGNRNVLNKVYPDSGGEQAVKIIKDLCIHPSTARNIAFKLARHFVSDQPPEALIERLTDKFLATEGNLTEVYKTLIDAPEAWAEQTLKIKTPVELLISAARMMGSKTVFRGNLRRTYEGFGQRPFFAPSPEGWPDTIEDWLGPDAILKRLEWANRLAKRSADVDARLLLIEVLGARVSPDTLRAVTGAESGEQALTIALMSPDFQRR